MGNRGGSPTPWAPRGDADARRILESLLTQAYGAPDRAAAAMSVALELARRTAPPPSGTELVEFVRAHLVVVLEADLGAHRANALLDALVARLAPPQNDSPPASVTRPLSERHPPHASRDTPSAIARAIVRPSRESEKATVAVLLVDADRVGRTALSRALVRGGCDVTVAESTDEVAETLRSSAFDIAVVDGDDAHFADVLEAIVDARPDLPIVARTDESAATRSRMIAAGVARCDVHRRDVAADALVLLARYATRKP